MYRIEGPEDGGKWPKGPNFGLIVTLFGVAIVVIFLMVYLFLPELAQFFHPLHPHAHPTS
jgi:hypothetical protein